MPKAPFLWSWKRPEHSIRSQLFKQFARLVLRKRYTDVAIDDMLRSDNLTYSDLARMAQDKSTAEGASLLKGVLAATRTLTRSSRLGLPMRSMTATLKAKGAVGGASVGRSRSSGTDDFRRRDQCTNEVDHSRVRHFGQ